ncbi:MAG: hypothetical protein Q7Q73_17405 [Verrucomicrobiota bacterium JB024]|nr:hypothetical protein [Verrucomicrobiota bacterium JB024]
MFDTVHYKELRSVNPEPTGDWAISHEEVKIEGEDTKYKAHARHKSLNLRAYSLNGHTYDNFHVPSLPELIYGHNAKVIESQADLDLALKVADLLFDQISSPAIGTARAYRRADVAAQLRMNYRSVHTAYSHARQTRSRKAPEIHPGESIKLPLLGQDLKFYDKGKQIGTKTRHDRKLKPPPPLTLEQWLGAESAAFARAHGYRDPEPDIVRIEVQFDKSKIVRFLGDGRDQVTHLDIDRAYQALRQVLLAIKVNTFPGVTRKLSTYLAVVNLKDPELYELYLNHCVGARRRKDLEREVSRYMPALFQEELDWDKLLPPDQRPSFPEIALPGKDDLPHDPVKGFVADPVTFKAFHPTYPDLVSKARQLLKK